MRPAVLPLLAWWPPQNAASRGAPAQSKSPQDRVLHRWSYPVEPSSEVWGHIYESTKSSMTCPFGKSNRPCPDQITVPEVYITDIVSMSNRICNQVSPFDIWIDSVPNHRWFHHGHWSPLSIGWHPIHGNPMPRAAHPTDGRSSGVPPDTTAKLVAGVGFDRVDSDVLPTTPEKPLLATEESILVSNSLAPCSPSR